MLSSSAFVRWLFPLISISSDVGITNRSSCISMSRTISAVPTPTPTTTNTAATAAIHPALVLGNPPRTRTRVPGRRRPTGDVSSSSEKSSAKSSVKSRRSFLFGATEVRRGAENSGAYSRSGVSSTAVPRFEDPLLFRKPEQGRENRHPDYILPTPRKIPSSSRRTHSGTHQQPNLNPHHTPSEPPHPSPSAPRVPDQTHMRGCPIFATALSSLR